MSTKETEKPLNFIEEVVAEDLANGKHVSVHTRFPPEPNGYLHIGHAKAIVLNFGLAQRFGGKTNLRFDDTNPEAEDTAYVEGIREDIKWLGYDWEDREFFASDYFQQMYDWAVLLIKNGKAYVDDSSAEEISRMRGVPTRPGENSPYRNRSVEENLDLFEKMKNGEFEEGARILRAKIDMASPNMHLRDPIMYRIRFAHHHRTGDKWCIYPTYDWAHGQGDAIEGISHSICTLEFEVHRPLYEWFLDQLPAFKVRPRQYEMARLNLNYTVMSKRKLRKMVEEGIVNGWDDPRMLTIRGLRRRGYTPAALRNFAEGVGVTKVKSTIDMARLEHAVREDLNKVAFRAMAVLDPVKVVITNFPEGETEYLPVDNNPEDESAGRREIPFGREIWIERDDFMEDPPKKFFRLGIERNVRLKGAYIIKGEKSVYDEAGKLTEIHVSYYPDSRSGSDTSGVKAKGTLHWVSVEHGIDVEARLYDRLFSVENPDGDKEKTYMDFLNPDSLEVLPAVKAEPALANASVGQYFQFMRKGYFVLDPDSTNDKIIFNRTVALRDGWAKKQKR